MGRAGAAVGDAEIRSALREYLQLKHPAGSDTVLLEELGLCRGQVRVDLAVVNGLLHGYEIKSDRDSLRRLEGQVELYGKVLDKATAVVGGSHLGQVLESVPEWWGVLLVQEVARELRFRTIRRGRMNRQRESRALVELLWLEEAIALLEQRDVARGVRGKPRRMVWDRVCVHFEVDEIADAVRAHLKARVEPPSPLPQS